MATTFRDLKEIVVREMYEAMVRVKAKESLVVESLDVFAEAAFGAAAGYIEALAVAREREQALAVIEEWKTEPARLIAMPEPPTFHDLCATSAMRTLLSGAGTREPPATWARVAGAAFSIADAMQAERDRRREKHAAELREVGRGTGAALQDVRERHKGDGDVGED